MVEKGMRGMLLATVGDVGHPLRRVLVGQSSPPWRAAQHPYVLGLISVLGSPAHGLVVLYCLFLLYRVVCYYGSCKRRLNFPTG